MPTPRDSAPKTAAKTKYKGKPPGGKRPPEALKQRRFEAIRGAMVQGYGKAEILAALIAADLGAMPERTLDDYMKRVRDSWQTEFTAAYTTLRQRSLRRNYGHLAKAVDAKHWAAVARFEEIIMTLEGTASPLKIETVARRGWDSLTEEEVAYMREHDGKLPPGRTLEELDRVN
jgi:uncharacterized protein YigA (DUF484 family)